MLAGLAGLAIGWEVAIWQRASITNEIVCFTVSLLVYIVLLILALGTPGAMQVGLRMAGAAYPVAIGLPYFLAWQQAVQSWGVGGLLLGLISVVPVAGVIAALFALIGTVEACPRCGQDALQLWRFTLCCPNCSEGPAGILTRDTLSIFRG